MTDERIKSYLKDRLKRLEDLKNKRKWTTSEHDGSERWWTTAELGDMACCKQTLEFIDSLQEEPISKDLEETARSYSVKLANICGSIGEQTRNAFKAGAKWQKNKMVQNTIDAHCFGFQGAALFSFRLPAGNYLVGSEVKVIVIKEDCI